MTTLTLTIHPNRAADGAEVVWDNERAVRGNYNCLRCSGTGRFITYVENGQPRGPGGECFRCGGKGYHAQHDRKRNAYYDEHRPVHL